MQIIPRAEGAEQVAALLTMQSRDRSQVLVGNWGMPAVTPLEAEQSVSATFAAPAASGFNGFLRSHEIQGKAVLPMTVAVAHMASTVLKAHPGTLTPDPDPNPIPNPDLWPPRGTAGCRASSQQRASASIGSAPPLVWSREIEGRYRGDVGEM